MDLVTLLLYQHRNTPCDDI